MGTATIMTRTSLRRGQERLKSRQKDWTARATSEATVMAPTVTKRLVIVVAGCRRLQDVQRFLGGAVRVLGRPLGEALVGGVLPVDPGDDDVFLVGHFLPDVPDVQHGRLFALVAAGLGDRLVEGVQVGLLHPQGLVADLLPGGVGLRAG